MVAVVAALSTLALKFWAAWITNSVGLFSDAVESIINVLTSVLLVILLNIAKAPPDEDHPYGHDKAEYFANGMQGALILLAALGIASAAYHRFVSTTTLLPNWEGIALSVVAALINLLAAKLLRKEGKAKRSEALVGEADHLMSDVWTSVAVLGGVGLVYLTNYQWLDPLIAAVLSIIVFRTGGILLKRFVRGLMDSSVSEDTQQVIEEVLNSYKREHGIEYHALRTRVAGSRTFVSVHILVPGDWTVLKGHDLTDDIEEELQGKIKGSSVITHLEPAESHRSFQDIEL